MNKASLKSTKDYSIFTVSNLNRATDAAHIRKLKPSMQEYGWIPAFPMLVHRTAKGLEIIDGQHRFMVAKELSIPVWFVETDDEYDVAKINQPQSPWKTKDYAETFARRGIAAYDEALEFAKANYIPLSDAAAMLAGTVSFHNIRVAWLSGNYKIKDREYANAVAFMYTSLRQVSRSALDRSMLLALMAVARVPNIDLKRLIRNAEALPDRFEKYSTREGSLTMLEEIYNFRIREKFPLKIAAENAMRERDFTRK